jgi:hypothetical protein
VLQQTGIFHAFQQTHLEDQAGEPERTRVGEGNDTPETNRDEQMLCTNGENTWNVIHTRTFVTLPDQTNLTQYIDRFQ